MARQRPVQPPQEEGERSSARIKPPPNGKADRAQDPGQDAFFLRLLSEHLRGRDDARFERFYPVVLGTTLGMMLANIPAVLIGDRVAERLPVGRSASPPQRSLLCSGY